MLDFHYKPSIQYSEQCIFILITYSIKNVRVRLRTSAFWVFFFLTSLYGREGLLVFNFQGPTTFIRTVNVYEQNYVSYWKQLMNFLKSNLVQEYFLTSLQIALNSTNRSNHLVCYFLGRWWTSLRNISLRSKLSLSRSSLIIAPTWSVLAPDWVNTSLTSWPWKMRTRRRQSSRGSSLQPDGL